MKLLALGFLMVMSYSDVKRKEVNVHIIGLFLALALIVTALGYHVYEPNFLSVILGTLLGIIIYGISILTKGEIGEGDAYVIIALGMMLGCTKVFFIVSIAFVLAAVSVLILKLSKKISISSTLPFVPYILASYVVFLLFFMK